MSGPANGKYFIQLATDRNPLIGIDPVGNAPVPVITDGNNNVWTVKRLGDAQPSGIPYDLVLEGTGHPVFVRVDDDGDLFTSDRQTTWYIDGDEGGPYRIDGPGDLDIPRAWTVKYPEPKSPVTVEKTEQRNQKWNFIPWLGPE